MPNLSPRYEIVYFDIRARAEPIRVLLALAGQPFTDTRVTFDDWPNHKPKAPLGQAPWLIERDGDAIVRQVPQSQAILRHLARVHGLYGAGEDQHLACDVALETVTDLRAASAPVRFGPGSKDLDARAKFRAETLPHHLNRLKTLLAAGGTWLAGSAPTVADVALFDIVETLVAWEADCLADAPELTAFADRFRRIGALADYFAERARANR